MIDYVANFYGAEKRPYICKKFTASNGEEAHTPINVGNEDEIKNLSAEIIYEHMNNVIKYLDEKIDTMTIVQLDEIFHKEAWPIVGWSEVEWCQNEVVLWWNYIFYKDFDERAERIIHQKLAEEAAKYEEEHVHSGTEDHTHDPATGEEIPNEPTPEETQP
jgi:hypothetical protein